ncbi:hypothetical protein [Paenibacillus agilis]|uniref:Uncharacterized protein n=1 Tax=Paenibacillus agilis TaxID=3020863 RepID=A0A559IZF2_9BACL|nr:hypothetical protein [Paenibacillus agilis]TVX93008.1 hypothetical protein FPZ44_08025 [Paenibacillus agilis]
MNPTNSHIVKQLEVKKEVTTNEAPMAVSPEELGVLFAIIPDDLTHTMILCPVEVGQTAIKLTEKTAKILVAMLDHQIQEWS